MSFHFVRQIDKLKQLVLTMGGLVEECLERAIQSVNTQDVELARQVIASDARIDEMDIEIEEECLKTLALYQPVASDLRFVVSILKINKELERIADMAVNVAEQGALLARQLNQTVDSFPPELIEQTGRVRFMLKASLDALVTTDAALAEQVRVTEDEVDEVHRKMYMQVKDLLRKRPEDVDALINLLNISRQLERIGDQAVNIAEDIIYMANGSILRHNRPHPIPKRSVTRVL